MPGQTFSGEDTHLLPRKEGGSKANCDEDRMNMSSIYDWMDNKWKYEKKNKSKSSKKKTNSSLEQIIYTNNSKKESIVSADHAVIVWRRNWYMFDVCSGVAVSAM